MYYFDHFEIDGTVFDGYYYHDESGKFTAGNSHMVQITDLKAPAKDGSGAEVSFDGCYMVNNLENSAPLTGTLYGYLVVDKTTYNGLYYFDEYGKMVTDPGIHYLEMMLQDRCLTDIIILAEKTAFCSRKRERLRRIFR